MKIFTVVVATSDVSGFIRHLLEKSICFSQVSSGLRFSVFELLATDIMDLLSTFNLKVRAMTEADRPLLSFGMSTSGTCPDVVSSDADASGSPTVAATAVNRDSTSRGKRFVATKREGKRPVFNKAVPEAVDRSISQLSDNLTTIRFGEDAMSSHKLVGGQQPGSLRSGGLPGKAREVVEWNSKVPSSSQAHGQLKSLGSSFYRPKGVGRGQASSAAVGAGIDISSAFKRLAVEEQRLRQLGYSVSDITDFVGFLQTLRYPGAQLEFLIRQIPGFAIAEYQDVALTMCYKYSDYVRLNKDLSTLKNANNTRFNNVVAYAVYCHLNKSRVIISRAQFDSYTMILQSGITADFVRPIKEALRVGRDCIGTAPPSPTSSFRSSDSYAIPYSDSSSLSWASQMEAADHVAYGAVNPGYFVSLPGPTYVPLHHHNMGYISNAVSVWPRQEFKTSTGTTPASVTTVTPAPCNTTVAIEQAFEVTTATSTSVVQLPVEESVDTGPGLAPVLVTPDSDI